MTEPAVYVTEAEIVERMGVGINSGRKALQKMRQHPRFPPKTIGGKRFWPSVAAFLHLWNGLTLDAPSISAGQENHNGQTAHSGRARTRLEAAKERLGRRLAGTAGHREEGVPTEHEKGRGFHQPVD